MNELKQKLISDARRQHGPISPCAGKPTLDDCFTIFGNKLVFWFNTTADESTRAISAPITENA